MPYTTATVIETNINGDGSVQIAVVYTGDANEPKVQEPQRYNATGLTLDTVRGQAMQSIARLNSTATFKKLLPAIGQTLDVTTPISVAVDNAEAVAFIADVRLLQAAARMALIGLAIDTSHVDVKTLQAVLDTHPEFATLI